MIECINEEVSSFVLKMGGQTSTHFKNKYFRKIGEFKSAYFNDYGIWRNT